MLILAAIVAIVATCAGVAIVEWGLAGLADYRRERQRRAAGLDISETP